MCGGFTTARIRLDPLWAEVKCEVEKRSCVQVFSDDVRISESYGHRYTCDISFKRKIITEALRSTHLSQKISNAHI